MGWRAFQEGLRRHGLACILGGVEKDIHEGLDGLDVFQEGLRRTFMRGIEKEIHEWAGMHSRRD